jgi:hypothetical protein
MSEPNGSPIDSEHDSPNESLISEERPIEGPSKMGRFVHFREWITRNKDEVQAWGTIVMTVATVVLAVITYSTLHLTRSSLDLTRRSLDEVEKQRELVQKQVELTREQFVIEHAPSVRAYITTGFEFRDERASLHWKVVNEGGTGS